MMLTAGSLGSLSDLPAQANTGTSVMTQSGKAKPENQIPVVQEARKLLTFCPIHERTGTLQG